MSRPAHVRIQAHASHIDDTVGTSDYGRSAAVRKFLLVRPRQESMMARPWEADPTAGFKQRLGKSALELGATNAGPTCPDIWELDNGDIAVIGRDLTAEYMPRLPPDVSIGDDERLVVLPRNMVVVAKPDIPDA
jgi:hypothetical protein